MKYFSAIKRNEVVINATAQMNCENIMLNERNQSQKTMYSMILFIYNVQNKQI